MSVKRENASLESAEQSGNTSDQFEFDTPTTGSVGSKGEVVNSLYK